MSNIGRPAIIVRDTIGSKNIHQISVQCSAVAEGGGKVGAVVVGAGMGNGHCCGWVEVQ